MACGSSRPARVSSSTQLSNWAESLPSVLITGMIFLRSSPKTWLVNSAWRAFIQLTLPRSVLISPLWAMYRFGWARSQLGKVLVEKRECTSAMAVVTAGLRRSA